MDVTIPICKLSSDDKIGSGSYANVYRVKINDSIYALKEINEEGYEVDGLTFTSEIDIMNRLVHPNLMAMLKFSLPLECNSQSKRYLTLFVPTTLTKLSQNPDYSFISRLIHIFDMVQGLAFLHTNGVLHNDIKGENILIGGEGAILTDFGSAAYCSRVKDGIDVPFNMMTKNYRAPEVLLATENRTISHVDEATDVWSLGITILESFIPGFYDEFWEYGPRVVEKQMVDKLTGRTFIVHERQNKGAVSSFAIQTFTDRKYESKLNHLPDEVIKLIRGMTTVLVKDRYDVDTILASPLFSKMTLAKGEVIWNITEISFKDASVIDRIIQFIKMYYKHRHLELLFLAVDLAYQVGDSLLDMAILVGSVTNLAESLLYYGIEPTLSIKQMANALAKEFGLEATEITSRIVPSVEQLIRRLGGRLYRRYLYHACNNLDRMREAYRDVIFKPQVYLTIDLIKWSAIGGYDHSKDKLTVDAL